MGLNLVCMIIITLIICNSYSILCWDKTLFFSFYFAIFPWMDGEKCSCFFSRISVVSLFLYFCIIEDLKLCCCVVSCVSVMTGSCKMTFLKLKSTHIILAVFWHTQMEPHEYQFEIRVNKDLYHWSARSLHKNIFFCCD